MKVLFAGPSLPPDVPDPPSHSASFVLAGPVARGDVLQAVNDGAVAIGIADGRFEDILSVWHKEILYALSQGVAVAGAASMGALRAAECDGFGMIGIGEVYRRYASGCSTDDADVGQVHAPAELNYMALTEPLVNIEPTLTRMLDMELIDPDEFARLMSLAQSLHYKDRTYRRLFTSARWIDAKRSDALLVWTADNAVNQKRLDCRKLIDWLKAQPLRRGQPPDWEFSVTSHWLALVRDVAERSTRRAA